MDPTVPDCPAARDLKPAVTDQLRASLEQHQSAQATPSGGTHPTFGAATPMGVSAYLASPLISLILGIIGQRLATEVGPPLVAALQAEQRLHPGFNAQAVLDAVNRVFVYLGAPPLSLGGA